MTDKRTLKVDYMARVEGEGALDVRIAGDRVEDVKLRIFEPPRFFEGLLRGRSYLEAPDITARICGICPVAYLMSACHAMEAACGVEVGEPLRSLRRLLYCGEWIESHVLHVGMLHLPDFLGLPDSMTLARHDRERVERILRIKAAGNALVALIGGREVHPVNVRVGGFYKAPEAADLRALRPELGWSLEAGEELLAYLSGLEFPAFEGDYQFAALRHPDEYPFNEGRIVTSTGVDVEASEYEHIFREDHVLHSTALHALRHDGSVCHTGPMARFALNHERLTPRARAAAERAGLTGPCHNPFKSILVRMVEVIFAFEEALRLIDAYQAPEPPYIATEPRDADGYGCTEAPRGMCWHHYRIASGGDIESARIVPPTCLNQPQMEADLYRVVADNLELEDDALRGRCEQAIRNYDPCISCATHFLKLNVVREPAPGR